MTVNFCTVASFHCLKVLCVHFRFVIICVQFRLCKSVVVIALFYIYKTKSLFRYVYAKCKFRSLFSIKKKFNPENDDYCSVNVMKFMHNMLSKITASSQNYIDSCLMLVIC